MTDPQEKSRCDAKFGATCASCLNERYICGRRCGKGMGALGCVVHCDSLFNRCAGNKEVKAVVPENVKTCDAQDLKAVVKCGKSDDFDSCASNAGLSVGCQQCVDARADMLKQCERGDWKCLFTVAIDFRTCIGLGNDVVADLFETVPENVKTCDKRDLRAVLSCFKNKQGFETCARESGLSVGCQQCVDARADALKKCGVSWKCVYDVGLEFRTCIGGGDDEIDAIQANQCKLEDVPRLYECNQIQDRQQKLRCLNELGSKCVECINEVNSCAAPCVRGDDDIDVKCLTTCAMNFGKCTTGRAKKEVAEVVSCSSYDLTVVQKCFTLKPASAENNCLLYSPLSPACAKCVAGGLKCAKGCTTKACGDACDAQFYACGKKPALF